MRPKPKQGIIAWSFRNNLAISKEQKYWSLIQDVDIERIEFIIECHIAGIEHGSFLLQCTRKSYDGCSDTKPDTKRKRYFTSKKHSY